MGAWVGHVYPRAALFGLPCPTTIFTFGVLLWAEDRVPWRMVLIPAVWSPVGFSAALDLGMLEDYGLVIAGFLGTVIIAGKNRQVSRVDRTEIATAPV